MAKLDSIEAVADKEACTFVIIEESSTLEVVRSANHVFRCIECGKTVNVAAWDTEDAIVQLSRLTFDDVVHLKAVHTAPPTAATIAVNAEIELKEALKENNLIYVCVDIVEAMKRSRA